MVRQMEKLRSMEKTYQTLTFDNKVINLPGGEISLSVLSQEDTVIPSHSGSIVRGAFLNLISTIDYSLADKLHNGNNVRPYSVESIKKISGEYIKNRRNDLIVKKGELLKLKLKVLDSDILRALIEHFMQSSLPKIDLVGKEYVISDLVYNIKRVELKKRAFKLKVNFLSPTYFSMISREDSMYFPEPKYLFMNLAKLWNLYNKEVFIPEKQFYEWLDKNARINDYSTRTKRVYIGKSTPIKGFQGWAVYRFLEEENFLPWIHVLAKFGELSNVGGSRTAGFGVMRAKWLDINENDEQKKK